MNIKSIDFTAGFSELRVICSIREKWGSRRFGVILIWILATTHEISEQF
jgi:hypothetical protein